MALVLVGTPNGFAKGYSSGGHSYSSHSSSFHSSSSHSSSFSSSRSSSGSGFGSHSFSSGGGKSYSSGGSQRSSSGYGSGSGKSYSSGSGHSYSQSSSDGSGSHSYRTKQTSYATSSGSSGSGPSSMTFDTAAARANKESASKRDFTDYRQSQAARSGGANNGASRPSSGYSGPVPPVLPRTQSSGSGGWYGRASSPYYHTTTVWYPDYYSYSSRYSRIHVFYGAPYWSRPLVVYNDPYSSVFWWWLLDQSLENQALWVYNHRYDMDDARYRQLVYQNLALENRVNELEQRQAPRDPNYVPTGMDRDMMYTDKYVNQAYANRPTHNGQILFLFVMVPTAIGVGGFFIWLVFFKRWHTAPAMA